MDNSFSANRHNSLNLNQNVPEFVDDGFRKSRTAPLDQVENIVLSTEEQSIQLNTEELDQTVLNNILYCFDFLDTNDKDYVNSAEAEMHIRQIKDTNPELFELLVDVLKVVSEYESDDANIAKNIFIARLKNHITTLKPEDNSSVYSLTATSNAISNYFKNLLITTKSSANETVFNPTVPSPNSLNEDGQTLFENTSQDFFKTGLSGLRHESKETVFHPRSEPQFDSPKESLFNPSLLDEHSEAKKQHSSIEHSARPMSTSRSSRMSHSLNFSVAEDLVYKHDGLNRFECVEDFQRLLRSTTKVNEYIVFNYNTHFDWEGSLRELC